MKKDRKVVVTGLGIASPAGYTLEENYNAWRSGRNCFTEITRFNTFGSSVVYAGDCAAPDVKKLPDRKIQKILRRKDIISLLCTIDAANNAGIKKGSIDPERFGMYVGAGSTQIGDLTPYFTLVAECANLEDGTFDSAKFGAKLMDLVNPLVVLQTLMNNALCFGTMTLDIRGVNSNFMDFHVAGLRAIGEAYRSIAYDRADAVIAGGVAGPVEPFQLAEGIHSGYLAKTKDLKIPVSEVVRPWDQNRMGAVLSEGSAYLVLEEEKHARGGLNLVRPTKILFSLCAHVFLQFAPPSSSYKFSPTIFIVTRSPTFTTSITSVHHRTCHPQPIHTSFQVA
jgi:3-oxoacyl-[acyl-carrier-protein] synthase II